MFGTPDDIRASAGVPSHLSSGHYQANALFGLAPQVGARKSPSTINSGYSPQALFWDGRAGSNFVDPITGIVLIQQGGALENQALMPLLDTSEMAPINAVLNDLPARLAVIKPLALASLVPSDLNAWIN